MWPMEELSWGTTEKLKMMIILLKMWGNFMERLLMWLNMIISLILVSIGWSVFLQSRSLVSWLELRMPYSRLASLGETTGGGFQLLQSSRFSCWITASDEAGGGVWGWRHDPPCRRWLAGLSPSRPRYVQPNHIMGPLLGKFGCVCSSLNAAPCRASFAPTPVKPAPTMWLLPDHHLEGHCVYGTLWWLLWRKRGICETNGTDLCTPSVPPPPNINVAYGLGVSFPLGSQPCSTVALG